MELLKIGKIVGTHALKGEVKIRSNSDFNEEHLKKGKVLYIRYQKQDEKKVIASVRIHKGNYLVAFEDYQDINLVEKYIGCFVYALKDETLLGEDEYYIDDIVGCKVYQEGQCLGVVSRIMDNGRHDILVIQNDTKEFSVPYVDAFIKEEDIENKRIEVSLIKGMLDED